MVLPQHGSPDRLPLGMMMEDSARITLNLYGGAFAPKPELQTGRPKAEL
jgi:hypothetical protein